MHKVITAYKSGYETLPSRTGRPPIMTERDGHQLQRIIKKDRKLTLKEIQEEFVNSTSTNVCMTTLKNYLHDQGYYEQKNP